MKIEAKDRLSATPDELTPKQKQLDVNGDGKISGDDLSKLRKGEKPQEASTVTASWQAELAKITVQSVVDAVKQLSNLVKIAGINADAYNDDTEIGGCEVYLNLTDSIDGSYEKGMDMSKLAGISRICAKLETAVLYPSDDAKTLNLVLIDVK